MIKIEIQKEGKEHRGFRAQGHAGYANEGYDIICSAVSALLINTVNSIEQFTKDRFTAKENDGLLVLSLEGEVSKETDLLLNSMILGLKNIQRQYGNEYIKLKFREV